MTSLQKITLHKAAKKVSEQYLLRVTFTNEELYTITKRP